MFLRFRSLTVVALLLAATVSAEQKEEKEWHFAVSGDSRNCGDVVMPAIAKDALQHQIDFYWHLGDFRLMTDIDEDMRKRYEDKLTLDEYWRIAWGDFLANQVAPFGLLPVHLGIGNHEVAGNKAPTDFLVQFAYWLDTPELRTERLNEYSQDGGLRAYHHWKNGHVDFIYLDNSSEDGFDDGQLEWFERILERDKLDKNVFTVVVGMHRALPNSLACGHSMNGDFDHPSETGTQSGRRAYRDLVKWKNDTKKFVYVLASHSHFFMQDVFESEYWENSKYGGTVLPGWIVGTAGAKRYQLPAELSPDLLAKTKAKTHVYGYLLATVHKDGMIDFDFHDLEQKDVPTDVSSRFGVDFVNFCFNENSDDRAHPPAESCKEK